MRASALLAALLAVTPGLAIAQQPDPALQAAVAPAQLLFDASAQVVDLAVSEATRDGTPDAAIALRLQIEAFAHDLVNDRSLSTAATHRDITLAALPVARRLPIVLGDVTDDVARLATSTERCAHQRLSEDDLAAILASRSLVQATAAELFTMGSAPPEGVDGSRLAHSAASLDTWSRSFESIRDCTPVAQGQEPPILYFQLQPKSIHPTGEVRLRGVTNEPGPVEIDVPDLALNESLDLNGRAFETTFDVPADMPYGDVLVRAHAGDRNATALLDVEPAATTLTLDGPLRAEARAPMNYTLRLDSIVPERTANATLSVTGDITRQVALENGSAILELRAPPEPGKLRFSVRFAGDHVVQAARRDITVYIGIAPPVEPGPFDPFAVPGAALEGAAGGPGRGTGGSGTGAPGLGVGGVGDGSAAGGLGGFPSFGRGGPAPPPTLAQRALSLVALVLVLALVARAVHGPWRRAAPALQPTARAPTRSPIILPRMSPFRAGFLGQFSRLTRALRARGEIGPSATPRKMQPILGELGFRAPEIVTAFERARYGKKAAPPWTARLRDSFGRAWARLRGVER